MKILSLRKFPSCFGSDTLMTLSYWHFSSHNVDNILQTINSFDSKIQSIYEIERNGSFPFLDIPFSYAALKKTWQFLSNDKTLLSLPTYARSYYPPSQKMAEFSTIVNRAINICSDLSSLNSEIYLKAVAFDRSYNSLVMINLF